MGTMESAYLGGARQSGRQTLEGKVTAMNIAAKIRARRVEARTRKAVSRAIDSAPIPSMRHELITLAQVQNIRWR